MLKPTKQLKLTTKYLAASLLLVIPLLPKFPFIKVPGTFVSIRIEDILLAISFLVAMIWMIIDWKKQRKDILTTSILFYLSIGFISLLSAVFVTKTTVAHIGFLHWARRIEYFTPLVLAYFATRSDKKVLNYFLVLLAFVVLTVFLYGLAQRFLSAPIIITQNAEYSKGVALRWIPGSHINSTFAGHYDLATFLVMVLPIFLAVLVIGKTKFERITSIAVLVGGLWLMVNSASRISFVSYLISGCITLFLLKKDKIIPLFLIISIMFVGFSANMRARYERFFSVVKSVYQKYTLIIDFEVLAQTDKPLLERQSATPTPTPLPPLEDRSTNIRFNVEWPRAIRAFEKNPLLGTGYSSITLATDNDYLRALGETGLLGFLSLILILSGVFYIFYSNFPLSKGYSGIKLAFLTGVVGGFVGILINAVFIDIFEASKFATMFWFLVGVSKSVLEN